MKPAIMTTSNLKRGYKLPGGEIFWALKGLNVSMPEGGLTILKGRSGSGKTTLMNILGGLDRATEGSVCLDGKDYNDMNDTELAKLRRSSIGFIFQSVALIPFMTARENVEYVLRLSGYKQDLGRRAKECLDLVGLGARMQHMPSELSGGEQQRVAVARAIAHSPRIVFADEPTGELDTKTAISVVKIFKELNESLNVTIVMSTHDIGFMDIGDRVYEIEDGEIVNER